MDSGGGGGGYLQVWTGALGRRRSWILLRCLGQMFEHDAALHRETSGDDTVAGLNVMRVRDIISSRLRERNAHQQVAADASFTVTPLKCEGPQRIS